MINKLFTKTFKKKLIISLFIEIIIFIVFAFIYYFMDTKNFNNMKNSLIDSIYFSIVTSASVGYGDITPKTDIAKILVLIQIILTYTNISIVFL